MGYKNGRWKPSKTQAREFAKKMETDPNFAADYAARKVAKDDKRRASSQFDYRTAGGEYIPTQQQHDAAFKALGLADLTQEQRNACELVMSAYSLKEKAHHDHIHIVNELRRENNFLG